MDELERRLDFIRGGTTPMPHTARTIAALTGNPGCARRAVLDAAGVDKQAVAARTGFPARFGQSGFAISRGNAFEAQVKANGCAELLRLLRDKLMLPIPEVAYDDLEAVGANASPMVRHVRTRELLRRAARSGSDSGTLFDHPMLRLNVGGREAFLEPDLVAFKWGDKFHVVEIKSFPVVDGHADEAKVAAAATQGAVYVLALRRLLSEVGYPEEIVAHDVVLVCPENFANRPTANLVDVRKRLMVLTRQLHRLERVADLVAALPSSLSFDIGIDDAGGPTRSPDALADAVRMVEPRYAPECLATCEMAYFCRRESRGQTSALGQAAREELGGVEHVAIAMELAHGLRRPAPDQVEAARVLRLAQRLRAEYVQGPAAAQGHQQTRGAAR
jgi:hypothetical protein